MQRKKIALRYRTLKRFNVIEIGGVQKFIVNSDKDEVRYYLSASEIREVFKRVI